MSRKYVDLHCHLDGSVSLEMAQRLMETQGISFPNMTAEAFERKLSPDSFRSLEDFLGCFEMPLALLQTKTGITLAARLLCDTMKSQGVIYSEIRFAPQYHTKNGLSQEEVVRAALYGMAQSDLPSNLILCLMRGDGFESGNEETLRVAKTLITKDGGVVGIDLAGSEEAFPVPLYAPLFRSAQEHSIPYTIHAGEAAGAENVSSAVLLGARRIGHGVRSMEDASLVDQLVREGITLEMCPTSNRKLHVLPNMDSYPLLPFLHKGVKVTVNTDDMGILQTSISEEYRYLKETFGMTEAEEEETVLNGIEAAFTSEETKRDLRRILYADKLTEKTGK